MSDDYYIGVMSGTSFDGIDTVLARFKDKELEIIAHHSCEFPQEIKQKLLKLADPLLPHLLEFVYELDSELGQLYAQSIESLLNHAKILKDKVRAIGCHGQTIRHFPHQSPGFTAQIGDPNIVASRTGITTVADFRRRDLAHGGQGAPLAPAFHHHFFHSEDENRAVVNIGGFANVTLLPSSGNVSGFDTGPGNCFLDALARVYLQEDFDRDGAFAASGKVCPALLSRLLSHPFFARTPPKSTGRDQFNLAWLENILSEFSDLPPEDSQATLAELTAVSIATPIASQEISTVYLCGGGALNLDLVSRLATHLPESEIKTTEHLGIHPQLVESCLMAWLARSTINRQPIDLRGITGSTQPVMLGAVYYV